MTKLKRKKGYFSISAVAKMFTVHPQTIRWYEEKGLITPNRSDGNTRLFSEEDIDKLEEVIYLTHELGINLAGVEMIFKLKKQISRLQKDMNQAFEKTQKELDEKVEFAKENVQKNAQKLVHFGKKQSGFDSTSLVTEAIPLATHTKDNWQVKYDED
jgi:MerR family transcriptional regulator, heat shock protein HspR